MTLTGTTTGATDQVAPVLLQYEGVSKRYPAVGDKGEFTALEAVDLTIRRGEFVTLVGPSGCGKSTLLMITAALLKATEGTVRYDGRPMTEPDRNVGVMFQAPVLFSWRTVEKNVLLPAEIQGLDLDEVRPRARKVLDLVGLGEFVGAYPNQLSGGMQQRVSLARVLAYQPDVLLMDEPFGALDEFTREAMNLELLRLTSEAGITVLFVTHNIPEAVFLADKVVVMRTRPGRVAAVIDVPFERPRTIELMADERFVDLTFRVRHVLSGTEA